MSLEKYVFWLFPLQSRLNFGCAVKHTVSKKLLPWLPYQIISLDHLDAF